MKHVYRLLPFLLFFSCGRSEHVATEGSDPNPVLLVNEFKSWPQILLTNRIELNDGQQQQGASSFLVQGEKEVLLCTAKHLLDTAFGFKRAVPVDSFNIKASTWLAYPRAGNVQDTVSASMMVTDRATGFDLILLKLHRRKHSIHVLQPAYINPKGNEPVYMVGCEYNNTSCAQQLYKCVFKNMRNGLLQAEAEGTLDISGFSGAPLLNKYGYVIGVVTGGYEEDGIMKIMAEPLFNVKMFLK